MKASLSKLHDAEKAFFLSSLLLSAILLGVGLQGCSSTSESQLTPESTYTLRVYSETGSLIESHKIKEYHNGTSPIYFYDLDTHKMTYVSDNLKYISTEN